jgi:hypothetical protein
VNQYQSEIDARPVAIRPIQRPPTVPATTTPTNMISAGIRTRVIECEITATVRTGTPTATAAPMPDERRFDVTRTETSRPTRMSDLGGFIRCRAGYTSTSPQLFGYALALAGAYGPVPTQEGAQMSERKRAGVPAARVQQRASELLAEEQRAGSDDPIAQAEEILADSEIRTVRRIDPTGPDIEQRHSEDTVDLTSP